LKRGIIFLMLGHHSQMSVFLFENKTLIVGFEVLVAAVMKNTIF
jgi:hypothetical protein